MQWSAVSSSPSSPFLGSDHPLLAHQQLVWSRCLGDVFTLVADDRCNSQLEVLGRFNWPLLFHRKAIMLCLTARTPQPERPCLSPSRSGMAAKMNSTASHAKKASAA